MRKLKQHNIRNITVQDCHSVVRFYQEGKTMHDVIIIGKGPAGISAALYTIRANLETLVIGTDAGALVKAGKIENYYGLAVPISGIELMRTGELQVTRLGGTILQDEVLCIDYLGHFEVKTLSGSHQAKSVLIATGAPVIRVPVKGLQAFEGRGVSYCTTCDGFFHRGKPVGIIGYNDYGVHEAVELLSFTSNVTFFTNGKQLQLSGASRSKLSGFTLVETPISELYGEETLAGVRLADGSAVPLSGLFVAYGSASGATFALKMGIEMDGSSIRVDERMATNIPGLFAAGDVTGGFKQVSVAVGQGALAGRHLIEYVRRERELVP